MINDYDRKLMIFRKSYRKLKEKFPEKKIKTYCESNIVSWNQYPKLEDVLVYNKPDFSKSELEKLPKLSADNQYKDLKYTLNSMNEFILLLVIYFMESWFKILRMSWYTSMKLFRDNLDLVIKKYFCSFHNSLPSIDPLQTNMCWLGWESIILLKISFQFCLNWIFVFTQMIIGTSINLYIWPHTTDEYYTEEYMEFSKKCCIWGMAEYTSGDCVNFKDMTDIPNEHHNSYIFNHIHDMYITS